MRALVVRQRVARTAIVAASVALVAACGATRSPDNSGSLGDANGFTAGVALVSDGTNVVRVGNQKVTFPTTVTDAIFSPDGSRVAFVNGDGNIATARPDGSAMRVLTGKVSGAVRSRPGWSDGWIIFSETKGSATVIQEVVANGSGTQTGAAQVHATFLGFTPDGQTDESQSGVMASVRNAADGRDVAFQRAGSKGPEVWVTDRNQRQPVQSKLADGSEPAISPDGKRVAYVDLGGQVEVIDATTQGAKPAQITFGVAAPKHLAWTPDGARVAFSTTSDVESVSAAVAAGATSNPATVVSSTPGVVTFLPPARDQVSRIAGSDPVELSIAASQSAYATQQKSADHHRYTCCRFGYEPYASAVLLTGTANLPAVLAGAQMVDDGPLLFTSGSGLDSRTAAEMTRILGTPTSDFTPLVTIVGGTDVVPAAAETAVKAMGYDTTRVSATDPYTMSVKASGTAADAYQVFVVDANEPAAYASAISDLGAGSGQTVLMTNGSTMSDGVRTFLNGLKDNVKVFAVGAGPQAALAASWPGKHLPAVVSLVGANQFATTSAMLTAFTANPTHVVVVDASSTTDLIAAIGLARGYGAPVLAIDPKAGLDATVSDWLSATSGTVDSVLIVDSKGAISADVQHAMSAVVAGPLGATTNNNPKAA